MATSRTEVQTQSTFPAQIRYIVGNEAAERFSFYGMRAILFVYMTQMLMMDQSQAGEVYHYFGSATYFLPVIGGFISDRFWGKYRTIMVLSLVYCLGHGVLALFDGSVNGLYWGLALIAIGAGGIKPCVSAHVGDQFNEKNKNLIPKVFDLFYFSINLGAFFSSLLIPVILARYGASVAFAIPGILMGVATLVFWMGRTLYVHVPPTGKTGQPGFVGIVMSALRNRKKRPKGGDFFEAARAERTPEQIEGARAVWEVMKVFIYVLFFWALFDQQGSSWVEQATHMYMPTLPLLGKMEAAQMQAANPILVMLFIPVFAVGIYPWLEKRGVRVTALRAMSVGMLMAALSFVSLAVIQHFLNQGQQLSVLWQLVPYCLITISEVMVSIRGLEFAYTQAPRAMKSTLMSFWLLTVSFGDLLAAQIFKWNHWSPDQPAFFLFFAVLMFAMSLVFVWAVSRYKGRDFIESSDSPSLDEHAESPALSPEPV
jgi:POT family proton-dependent oligopeptide transporter